MYRPNSQVSNLSWQSDPALLKVPACCPTGIAAQPPDVESGSSIVQAQAHTFDKQYCELFALRLWPVAESSPNADQ